ncbi:L-rhamnose-binding lectin CSL2-like [Acanthopagrus schlegelii]
MRTDQNLGAALLLTVLCCSSATTAERTLTCDLQDYAQRLTCYGSLIVVQNVNASHRESEVCVDGVPPTRLQPPLCSMTPVLNTVKKRCDGRYRCSVKMDSCHFAKPCMTRCVWMETTYTCETGRIHYVCQRRRSTLDCGSQVIKVLRANYGRLSKRVCWYDYPDSHPPSTACRDSRTLQVMADRCDGRHRCSVRASNSIFSNPCPGTRKYLKYSYTCVDRE